MHAASAFPDNEAREKAETLQSACSKFRRVVACIDDFQDSRRVVPYAVAAAKAFGADLSLMHVVESKAKVGAPPDAIASSLLRREAQMKIEELSAQWAGKIDGLETVILEGHPGDQICLWTTMHDVDLTAICIGQGGPSCDWDVGDTARRVMDCVRGSVLLVPENLPGAPGRCRRLLAPLDGSSRAESALPIALDMAKAENAELILAHAVPQPNFTDIGPTEPEDEELRQRLLRRNERAGRTYLNRIRDRLSDQTVPIRTVIVSGGDPRHMLERAALDERADMIVISSHGRSGHVDMAAGSVASHLMTHASTPLLLVRCGLGVSDGGTRAPRPARAGLRLPTREVA